MKKIKKTAPKKTRKNKPIGIVGTLAETSDTKNCHKLTYRFNTVHGVNLGKITAYFSKSVYPNSDDIPPVTLEG